jgi:hypothetical protein
MGFFKFDQLITPKILAVVYLLLVIFCVVMALKRKYGELMLGWVFTAVINKIPFELVMVTQKQRVSTPNL